MEVITEEAVSARVYPGLEETPEFRGMLFMLHGVCCVYDIIQMLFLDESGNRSECIWTFM
jgi:hypothetical protein